jgi:N-methylhydantoinase A
MDLVHVRRVIVPPHPGLFSALGLLSSDLVYADSRSAYTVLDAAAAEAVNSVFASMEAGLLAQVATDSSAVEIRRTFDGRLLGQTWETPLVEVPGGEITPDAVATMVENFHREYRERTGNRFDGISVQGVTFRVEVVVPIDKVSFSEIDSGGGPIEPARTIPLRYLGGEEQAAGEYQRDALRSGDRIEGPAVIREAMSTTHVVAGLAATVGGYGELVIERN